MCRKNRSEPPEREGIFWIDEKEVEQLRIVCRVGNHGVIEANNVIAWVIQGAYQYLDSRPTQSVKIPQYYKNWEEDFGDGEGLYRGQKIKDETRIGILARRAESALKTLTGGGLYDPEDYELIDAAPVPVLRGPEGAVVISPVHITHK